MSYIYWLKISVYESTADPYLARSASYLCLVGLPMCKPSLDPLLVRCWLYFTRPLGVKPALSAYSCWFSYSTIDIIALADIFPKVPSRLPALRYHKYHDHEQSDDFCVCQVCQSLAWGRFFAFTDEILETVDFQRVGSSQKFTRNMRCHSTRSYLPRFSLSSSVASFLAHLGKTV